MNNFCLTYPLRRGFPIRVLADPGRHCSCSCILASSPATTAKRIEAVFPAALSSSKSLSTGTS